MSATGDPCNFCGPWRQMPYGPSKWRELITLPPIVKTLNTWTLKSRITSPAIYTVRTCPNPPRLYFPIHLGRSYKFTNRSTLFVTSTFYFIKKNEYIGLRAFPACIIIRCISNLRTFRAHSAQFYHIKITGLCWQTNILLTRVTWLLQRCEHRSIVCISDDSGLLLSFVGVYSVSVDR